MAGTIDSAVIKKNDEGVEQEAKTQQKEAEKRRAAERREGPEDQAPGAMPPEHAESE